MSDDESVRAKPQTIKRIGDTQRALDAEAKLTDLAHEMSSNRVGRALLVASERLAEQLDFARAQRDLARRIAITGWIAAAGLAVVLVFVLGGK
jgi:hypothetical protein